MRRTIGIGLWLSAAVVSMAGCATVSDVTPWGNDTYMVASHVRGGMTSWNEVKAMAVTKANAYCQQQGKTMELVGDVNTAGVRGWSPQEAEVRFKCVA